MGLRQPSNADERTTLWQHRRKLELLRSYADGIGRTETAAALPSPGAPDGARLGCGCAGGLGKLFKLTASDATPRIASGRAIAADRNLVAIGSGRDNDAGAFPVVCISSTRPQASSSSKLIASDAAAQDGFGLSVAAWRVSACRGAGRRRLRQRLGICLSLRSQVRNFSN